MTTDATGVVTAPEGSSDVSTLDRVRVLVTGGSGFIGSHVVRRLIGDGATVLSLSSSAAEAPAMRLADVADAFEVVTGNLRDPESLARVVTAARPDVVIHLAALTHVGRSFFSVDETIQTNVQGTVN